MLFIVRALVRWRGLIILAGLGTAAVMAGVSFLLPKWYKATTSVFPPETKSALPFYVDVVQSLQLPIFGPNAIGARPNTVYIDILQSRTVGRQIIDEFEFKRVYGTGPLSEAIAQLHAHTSYSLLENGLLMISFEDRDPQRAADVTNRYVELLDQFNRHINVTRASKTKEFVSEQIDIHAKVLREAEELLRSFQEQHQTLELDEQIRSAIEVVSGMTAEAVKLEVELQILGQYTSGSSEEFTRTKKRYDGLVQQLKKFKVGDEKSEDDVVRSFFPTFEDVPEMALDLARLTRRVKIEEKVYELLITEYERARIEEARDTPTVQVLDAASVPELRSRPKRKVLVVLGGILGLGWSALLAVFVTAWREGKGDGGAAREVLAPLLSDFRRPFRKNG
ncbi:MAG: GumC family protein [Candidatus Krumholzibacteriia bacterium]